MPLPSAAALLTALMLTVSAQAADKKEGEKLSEFNPKAFLSKAISKADKDRDGSLSIREFEKLPLLREAKKGKIDELFVTIDADSNGALSSRELTKGLGKITDLVKTEQSGVDDAEIRRRAKKFKRALKP